MAHASVATYERVYVWELPVRFYHWVNALCVVVLIVTGFIIGHPVSILYASEAYQQYWFGTVRFAHFLAAFVFFFMFLVRIYWGFVGNAYARWTNFIPYKQEQIEEIGDIVKVDILQTKIRGDISIGHNALAGFIYFLSFLA
ncbi:MAG TPA: cytochrome b/b6 domain-containing protein, partial [Terriglobales bacterium]